jgi:uncharacterized DUF497 family protein
VFQINLDWDDESVGHIDKHAIEPEEVEAVYLRRHLRERGRRGRLYILGQTAAGRYLFIVLARRRSGHYRVITAREMTPQERKRYRRRIQQAKRRP